MALKDTYIEINLCLSNIEIAIYNYSYSGTFICAHEVIQLLLCEVTQHKKSSQIRNRTYFF